jgi:FK506-binding protein 2
VLEVKYVMRLQDGTVVDTSGEASFDNNYFFALGSAPQEPLPLGWDVGLLGMAVGERRVVTTPSSLGYGAKGLPEYRIPANADILYDVTLVSLNGE